MSNEYNSRAPVSEHASMLKRTGPDTHLHPPQQAVRALKATQIDTFMSSHRHTNRFPSPQVVMTAAGFPAGSRQPFLSTLLMVLKSHLTILFSYCLIYNKTQFLQFSFF